MHAASGSPRKGTSQVIIKTEAKEGFNFGTGKETVSSTPLGIKFEI